jgi:uncharacterized protein
MKKMNPVVHFEMPASDRIRMADFYTRVFGWQTELLGEEMGNYVLATTTEIDEDGRPKHTGTINGGFYPRKDDWPTQYPSIVIAVDDIRESMQQIADAGGRLIEEPREIPGIGLYVSFLDSENNRLSILQPIM